MGKCAQVLDQPPVSTFQTTYKPLFQDRVSQAAEQHRVCLQGSRTKDECMRQYAQVISRL